MSLTAFFTRDPALRSRAEESLDARWHDVMVAPTWAGFRRALRERPVTAGVVDVRALPPGRQGVLLEGVGRRFPSVPLGVFADAGDLLLLHELGRTGVRTLILAEEGGARVLARSVADLHRDGATARTLARLGPGLPMRMREIVRAALETTHRQPGADGFARALGMSRPHLSRLLRAEGLPPAGHLLGWARLLHAAHWLPDPGRSGESVARQLEYANGSTFRRALRRATGRTPTRVVSDGGLSVVLEAFVRHLDGGPVLSSRRVA